MKRPYHVFLGLLMALLVSGCGKAKTEAFAKVDVKLGPGARILRNHDVLSVTLESAKQYEAALAAATLEQMFDVLNISKRGREYSVREGLSNFSGVVRILF